MQTLLAELLFHIFRDLKGMICPTCDARLYFPQDNQEACTVCDPTFDGILPA